ncbi:iron chelate uptake ABC transporter family permease subunit [Tropicimonas marinistellae]|uniref:iron chelate uptake ABC transporter family permease subunit n=1 Tax=Tropicimonas marinistellae TaxID=1739787 RepID=UPI000835186C|nr:iron chelate uptake ABC transporter family permease subunit [Tropicimonas marinistellae]
MPDRRLVLLACLLVLACALFLVWGLKGRVGFILELRSIKLAALLCVGAAVGISTVVFQTVTGNRILTPAIMGFDALFLLMQTGLVFLLGGFGYLSLAGPAKFLLETVVMMAAAMALFSLLLGRGKHDMHRMILVGVIFGVFFRSLTGFLQRVIDPSEYSVVQGAMFASFGSVDPAQLFFAGAVTLAALAVLARLAGTLDVVALGRSTAIGLGLAYDRLVIALLAVTAALVSVSTALVGPITFLGLLVAALAHALMRSHRHAVLLPASAMIAATVLVAGQWLFERVLHLQSTLAVIIEFFGGTFFLFLVLKGRIR